VRAGLSIVVIIALIAGLALTAAHAGSSPPPKWFVDPCSLLTNENVFRLWGWTVTSKERTYHHFYSPGGYAFHQRGGWTCTFESSQGIVNVTVADPNSTFPGDVPFDDANGGRYTKVVHGYPASVLLFNGTAYIQRHGHQLSVQVVPYDHYPSFNEIEPVVPIIVREIP
jgi:hypothetical protein